MKLKNYELIIIKIGTNMIIKNNEINKEFLTHLAVRVSELIKKRKKVVIVSSGAVGLGKNLLELVPKDVKEQQGLAAIGQVQLMNEYQKRFDNLGTKTAQILVSQQDLLNKETLKNIKNTFQFLFEHNVVAIVNENDVVATEELRKNGSFSDNDMLSAILTKKLKANLLILITEKGGLIGKNGKILKEYKNKNELAELENTKGGRGGITSKIKAIRTAIKTNCNVFVTCSNEVNKIGKTKSKGTWVWSNA